MADTGKNKMVAALLAFFLGVLGVHHFYLGSVTTGLVTLAIVICTCGVGGILPFVEFILLLVMSDEDFDAKYNKRTPEGVEFVFMNK
ncbi:MAG TPA: TM2 domain-containing protein [Pirellulaceae bacterium]|jgi:TM2 domain-containing membrane protein YozV|nr:TM2 domain-containing protein [Pirellulaceae bacterium]